MGGRTQRRVAALLLASLVALQGCGAVGRRDLAERRQVEARLEAVQERGPLVALPSPRATFAAGGLQPTCGSWGGISRRDGVLLIGFLILAGPFLVLFEVLTAPFEFVGERL